MFDPFAFLAVGDLGGVAREKIVRVFDDPAGGAHHELWNYHK